MLLFFERYVKAQDPRDLMELREDIRNALT